MTIQSVTNAALTTANMTTAVGRLTSQNTALQQQVSSGVSADSYAGLGSVRYEALDLQPQITQLGAWQQNVTEAQGYLAVTQTAMGQISDIGTALETSLISLQSDQSSTSIAAAATSAKNSLSTLTSLLNTKDGSEYVFGGAASDEPPVIDPSSISSGNFFQSIGSSVASVGMTGADAVETATTAIAGDNFSSLSIFSPALSTDAATAASASRSIGVGNGQRVIIGFVATQGGPASLTSTGSPIRDLMRSLAIVANLGQADAGSPSFSKLVTDTASQVKAAGASLTASIATLGQTQNDLTARSSEISTLNDALTKQLSSVKGVDPAALSVSINQTQSQLTASYSIIADMKGMTLASYL